VGALVVAVAPLRDGSLDPPDEVGFDVGAVVDRLEFALDGGAVVVLLGIANFSEIALEVDRLDRVSAPSSDPRRLETLISTADLEIFLVSVLFDSVVLDVIDLADSLWFVFRTEGEAVPRALAGAELLLKLGLPVT
jgi:hypothetical protein